jgi:hypothetical protein
VLGHAREVKRAIAGDGDLRDDNGNLDGACGEQHEATVSYPCPFETVQEARIIWGGEPRRCRPRPGLSRRGLTARREAARAFGHGSVRALGKAGRVAQEVGNKDTATAIEASRAALAPAIVGLGIRISEMAIRARRKRGEAA